MATYFRLEKVHLGKSIYGNMFFQPLFHEAHRLQVWLKVSGRFHWRTCGSPRYPCTTPLKRLRQIRGEFNTRDVIAGRP